MYPNFYVVNEHRKELQRQADQYRLARLAKTDSVRQRVGRSLLNLGVKLAVDDSDECYTATIHDQRVTVCPA